MDTAAGLDAGLLVGGEHEIAGAKRLTFPETFVEIQDGAGLLDKARVARKDPGAMTPGTERVLTEPTPNGGAADLSGSTRRCGNSQARALTWTTRLGEKAGGTPASGLPLETWQAGQNEALTALRPVESFGQGTSWLYPPPRAWRVRPGCRRATVFVESDLPRPPEHDRQPEHGSRRYRVCGLTRRRRPHGRPCRSDLRDSALRAT